MWDSGLLPSLPGFNLFTSRPGLAQVPSAFEGQELDRKEFAAGISGGKISGAGIAGQDVGGCARGSDGEGSWPVLAGTRARNAAAVKPSNLAGMHPRFQAKLASSLYDRLCNTVS